MRELHHTLPTTFTFRQNGIVVPLSFPHFGAHHHATSQKHPFYLLMIGPKLFRTFVTFFNAYTRQISIAHGRRTAYQGNMYRTEHGIPLSGTQRCLLSLKLQLWHFFLILINLLVHSYAMISEPPVTEAGNREQGTRNPPTPHLPKTPTLHA